MYRKLKIKNVRMYYSNENFMWKCDLLSLRNVERKKERNERKSFEKKK